MMLQRVMPKVRAIVFHEHGDPATVVRLEELELAAPQPNEARVRILFAPVNPADLNFIEGKYPLRPQLPAVPGMEGVGVVEEVGSAVSDLAAGMRVLLPHGVGSWREGCVLPAHRLIRVPPEIPPHQAAMLKINPATAWRMLHDFIELRPGDWIAQNAGNSAVGRAVMQIARAFGIRTVSIVRRAELLEDLRTQGDVVLLDGETVREQIVAATGDAEIHLALNAVGGESALRLASALTFAGTIVTYGAMGRQPLRIPNGFLIFRDQRWRGFWITHWYEQASAQSRDAMLAELFALAVRGTIFSPIDKIFPLNDAHAALARAGQGGRDGKILLAFD